MRSCTRKQADGTLCGSKEDLMPKQNLCKKCKADSNKRYSASEARRSDGRDNWHKAAFEELAMFKEIMISWNRVSKG
jgi:hypothetical protein